MQARYYDPVIGRFYSNDPVGFTNVHTFNRYANNNPYKYTDPDGKFPLLILFAPELIALGNAALFTGSAALAGSEAINAYNESSEEQPEIKKQKQDEHEKGTTGDGTKGQFGVKVHQDSKGKIHGYPYGVDKSKGKT